MRLKNLKEIAMPIAMITGAMGYSLFVHLTPTIPYLLFAMLFIPFCRLSLQHLIIRPIHRSLILSQLLLTAIIYFALQWVDPTLAQGTAICAIVPTASSAAVVTGMLGGSISLIITYALVGNLALALILPFALSWIGLDQSLSIGETIFTILRQTAPILILPLLLSQLLRKAHNPTYKWIGQRQSLSFVLWIVALIIVTARTIHFIVEHGEEQLSLQITLAILSLFVCLIQFVIGKKIGKHYGDSISGGQAFGQKNTVMAIWIAQTYLSPLASIAPASYVVWQNLFNSWQLWRKKKKR